MRLRTFMITASAAALGISAPAMANDLLVEQIAAGGNTQNFADATQQGTNHETYIGQKTSSNTGVRNNSASGKIGGGNANQVDIEQQSNRNVATSLGIGDGNNNTAVIRQSAGRANYAAFQMAPGSNNTFGAIQEGIDNAVTSGGMTSLGTPFSNTVPGIPEQGLAGTLSNTAKAQVGGGDNNFGVVAQLGDSNLLALDQTGFDNKIVGGGTGKGSMVAPNLNDGLAPSGFFSDPTLAAATPGSGSIGDISGAGLGTQRGNNNQAILLQDGSANEVAFLQNGFGLTAEVRQVGRNNQAVAVQY